MTISLRGAVAAIASLLVAAPLFAQTPVFSESWENGTSRWRTADGNPITVTTDPNAQVCSTMYQSETILYSGGRVFTNNTAGTAGTTNIPVTGGGTYCLTAWVRGTTGAQPYLGYAVETTATSETTTGATWLMGGTVGSPPTQVTVDGSWHWYAQQFTPDVTTTFIDIVDENFNGGTGGEADFDDIALYNQPCNGLAPSSPHATCSGTTPICDNTPSDVTYGTCQACTGNGQCSSLSASTPVCDTTSDANKGACVQCTAATDCSATAPVCSGNSCTGCSTGTDCSRFPSQGVCETSGAKTGQCVQCASATDCSASAPVCDATANTCGACSSTADCSNFAGTVCDTSSDANKGKCVQCVSDSDCSGTGTICDPATNTCISGCRGGASPRPCPSMQFCTSETSAAGMCTTHCNFNDQCPPGDKCAPASSGAGGNFCVQCTADTDCSGVSGKPACSATFICVECTSTNVSACSATGNGAACLANNTCGCASDSDCGGTTSGRICDGTSHLCTTGCRGTGGNGCPSGMMCSSTDGTAGTCSAIPPVVDMAMPVAVVDMAMPGPDMTTTATPDMASAPDMAKKSNPGGGNMLSGGGGGCSCDVSGGTDAGGALFLLFALAFVLRRRFGVKF